jgi:hypothetical protein
MQEIRELKIKNDDIQVTFNILTEMNLKETIMFIDKLRKIIRAIDSPNNNNIDYESYLYTSREYTHREYLYNVEGAKQFLKDYSTLSLNEVRKKYNINIERRDKFYKLIRAAKKTLIDNNIDPYEYFTPIISNVKHNYN